MGAGFGAGVSRDGAFRADHDHGHIRWVGGGQNLPGVLMVKGEWGLRRSPPTYAAGPSCSSRSGPPSVLSAAHIRR